MERRKKASSFKRKERITSLLFIAPMYLQFLIFTLFFLGYSFVMGFTDWNVVQGTKTFVGIENFIECLTDPIFWKSVWNTIYLMIGLPIGMFISLLVAMALNRGLPGTTLFRVAVYLPAVTSSVAIAVLWRFIYDAEYGIINLFLYQLTGEAGPNWLGDPAMVKISLVIMGVWSGLGGNMLLFLAGLQNVPKEYYEVMDVEGGNVFHKFRYVTLPMLSPVIFYMLITGVIGGLQAFGMQFMMTGVGPEHSAITIVYYLWEKGFAQFDMGGACAVAWIVAILIFVITLIQFKGSKSWVYED